VEVGIRGVNKSEIVSGLEAGEEIVISQNNGETGGGSGGGGIRLPGH